MTYWVVTVQEDMLSPMIQRSVLPSDNEKATQLIKPGDYVIVYVSKYYARKFGGAFAMLVKVVGDWTEKKELVYPIEKITNKLVYTYETKVELESLGICKLKEIVYDLSFIENRLQLSKYVRGIPANLGKPIPEEDAKKIIECLNRNRVSTEEVPE